MIRNATFVNAEVKVIKCVVDNINVDVSAKQFNALSTVRLIEEFDRDLDGELNFNEFKYIMAQAF